MDEINREVDQLNTNYTCYPKQQLSVTTDLQPYMDFSTGAIVWSIMFSSVTWIMGLSSHSDAFGGQDTLSV